MGRKTRDRPALLRLSGQEKHGISIIMMWARRILAPKARGQTIVIVAVFVPVALALMALAFGVGSAWRQKAAVQSAADAASRAGSMQIDVEQYARGELRLDCAAAEITARTTLEESLQDLPFALLPGRTPPDIAATAEIHVVNTVAGSDCSVPDGQWTSPWSPHILYTRPVVSVQVVVPSKLFFMDIALNAVGENTVLAPGEAP